MRFSFSQIEAIKQDTEHCFATQAGVRLFGSRANDNQRGFTLVELVMTMVIVGILAAVVAPRFFDTNVFQSRGFADQVQASLRYAQKVAIAQRRNVCAAYTAGPARLTLTVTVTTSCDTALILPGSSMNYVDAPSGITFSMTPASVTFNALGRPSSAVAASIDTTTITIEAETGYVHSP